MNIVDELERLAKLHRGGELSAQEFARAKEMLLGNRTQPLVRSIRKQSRRTILGMPLWAVALGPDAATGELRGHAKAILAVGDMASGVLAIGGLARGVLAVGGLAVGAVAFGGAAIGLLFAAGGAAVGTVAIGGGALGYVAVGGGAVGAHTISGAGQDPEAIDFLRRLALLFSGPGR